MSKLVVLLVLCMMTFLSSLFFPARGEGQDALPLLSVEGWWGDQTQPLASAPQGGVFEVPIHTEELPLVMPVCIRGKTEPPDVCPTGPGVVRQEHLPPDTHLSSTNLAVASVEGTKITLKEFGTTTLELRQDASDILVTSYLLVIFAPSRPGTECVGLLMNGSALEGITDCSGKCASITEIITGLFEGGSGVPEARLVDNVCDNGMPRRDEKPAMDLSCSFFAQIFSFPGVVPPNLEGRCSPEGICRIHDERCTLEDSCTAQFGAAPGFKFCPDLTSPSVCSFNVTTGKEDNHLHGKEDNHTHFGTCNDMCQRFDAQCVGALRNDTPGCTPTPDSRDTCETLRQTAICLCERR